MAKPGESDGDRRRYSEALVLGTNLAAGMALFSFLGYYIDRRTGGGVRWTVAGACLGLCYGAYEVWRVVRRLNAPDDRDPPGGAAGG